MARCLVLDGTLHRIPGGRGLHLVCHRPSGSWQLAWPAQIDLFSAWEIERTAEDYRTAAIIFDDIGHDMMLDAGWERPGRTIVEWINNLA